jgi:hypothetical protein
MDGDMQKGAYSPSWPTLPQHLLLKHFHNQFFYPDMCCCIKAKAHFRTKLPMTPPHPCSTTIIQAFQLAPLLPVPCI